MDGRKAVLNLCQIVQRVLAKSSQNLRGGDATPPPVPARVNPRGAGGLDFPWSGGGGGGRFTPSSRLTRLLHYVATCGRRRSKARPKALRKYIGHF